MRKLLVLLLTLLCLGLFAGSALAEDGPILPKDHLFTTDLTK